MSEVPDTIADETALEELLSRPPPNVVKILRANPGDIVFLGVGGKMGPTLARMARRATEAAGVTRRISGVSRFTQGDLAERLESWGIEPIRGDLLDERFVETLPDAPIIVFMTGMKFGSSEDASRTWAMNTWVPTLVCRRYRRSRILAFSTGNVYPFVPVESDGSTETDPTAPVGEYGMSALGRERMFEYFSRRDGIPVSILRLNYAVEMRYGVLVDLATKVHRGETIDLRMGHANVVWQGDANALALAALADVASPPCIVNIAGAERLRVREVCERLGAKLGRRPIFRGEEASTALLNDGRAAHARHGAPEVSLERLVDWTADWIARGGVSLDRPTHFEVRDGRF